MPVLGVDVSHYQGAIDWDKVRTSAVRFAFVKATEGDHIVDARFEENWAGIAEQPLLLRGAYHFARPSRSRPNGAVEEAIHFAETVHSMRGVRDLPPALDLETSGDLSIDAMIDWVRTFIIQAELALGREVIIYTGKLWRDVLRDPLVPELGTRMLWTARYGIHQPLVPRTWSRWDFWQFTDGYYGDARRILGISGQVDCDWWRGDFAELQALAGVPPAP